MLDYIFLTNIPAFYKIKLYNELAKKYRIKVVFIAKSSNIRNQDFGKGEMEFQHVFINQGEYETRNKLITLAKFTIELNRHSYKYIVYPGWESIEIIPLMFLTFKKKNAIIIESSIIETITEGWKWWLKKLLLKRISLAFPSGVLQKKILEKANFKSEIRVTHGVGIIETKSRFQGLSYKTKTKNLKYLYVGRLSTEKNLEMLISVFNLINKQLTLIGSGPEMEYLKSISNNNINYLGYVNNQELLEIYSEYNVLILPSLSEPWGLVVDEALCHGLTAIVSDRVGCKDDLIDAYQVGEIFEATSKNALVHAVNQMEENYHQYLLNVGKINWLQRMTIQTKSYNIS